MPDSMRLRLDAKDRELRLERLAEQLGIEKEPYKADVIDAALVHLEESIENLEEARDELEPTTIQKFNTSVVGLKYRTSIGISSP